MLFPSKVLTPEVEPAPWREPVANLQAGVEVEESFRWLVQEHYATVLDFFKFRRFSPEESHDLAQETFLNVFRGIHSFRGESSPRTWIVNVAANVWRNELRHRSTVKRFAQEVSLTEGPLGVEEEVSLRVGADDLLADLLKEERRRLLLRKLQELPPQMRRCVLLRVLQDLKYHEIAAVLGISIQTVKSHLHQARRRLKESLGEVELHD
jgi:RNA polymerase sigma-70 factor (ECF subfamily)